MKRALAALLLLATGCEQKGEDRICGGLAVKLPPTIDPATDRRQVATACVERWAARLSFGPDDARDVADAAIGACDDAIQYLENDSAKADSRPSDMEAARAYWRRQAMFRAVQWRA